MMLILSFLIWRLISTQTHKIESLAEYKQVPLKSFFLGKPHFFKMDEKDASVTTAECQYGYYPSIDIEDKEFETKLVGNYKRDGLAVITGVFTSSDCIQLIDSMLEYIEKLNTGVKRDEIKKTWLDFNLPPQTRPGLFQALLSNMPAVWTIRGHEKVRKIFTTLYSSLRNKTVTDLMVSGDAINLRPNGIDSPFVQGMDWAHLDQTTRNDTFKCIQGQAVLSNTTAGFRASPGSHQIYQEILDLCGHLPTDTSQWCKLRQEHYPAVRELIESLPGGKFQIPILAPRGSFIVWSSTTLHSAKLTDRVEIPTPEDPYNGWRAVIYVSMQPKTEWNDAQRMIRLRAFEENRTTNHCGWNLFEKKPGGAHLYKSSRHPMIEAMLRDPTLVYKQTKSKPILTAAQQVLIGWRPSPFSK